MWHLKFYYIPTYLYRPLAILLLMLRSVSFDIIFYALYLLDECFISFHLL